MRYLITCFLGCALLSNSLCAQSKKTCLEVVCRISEIQAGVPFEVQYVYEGSDNAYFMPPDFESVGFRVVGTSQNSSMTWNGASMRGVIRYAYQLVGERPGNAVIPPGIITGKDKRCESDEIRLIVLDYREGKAPAPIPAPTRPRPKTPTIRL